jgi:monolysocardiolipin acyltransferase
VEFCLDRLNEGSWTHVYPEGQVNEKKTDLRLKWGVGRLVADSNVTPVVVPIYHLGMDEVRANVKLTMGTAKMAF